MKRTEFFSFYLPEDNDPFNLFVEYYNKNMELIENILEQLDQQYSSFESWCVPKSQIEDLKIVLNELIHSGIVSLTPTLEEGKLASAYSGKTVYDELAYREKRIKKNSITNNLELQSGNNINATLWNNI